MWLNAISTVIKICLGCLDKQRHRVSVDVPKHCKPQFATTVSSFQNVYCGFSFFLHVLTNYCKLFLYKLILINYKVL